MKLRSAQSIIFGIGLLLSFNGVAQESAAQRHTMATNQIIKVAKDISSKCLSDIQTLDDWKRRRVELRRELLEMLGLDPLPLRTPMKPEITGTIERNGYRIEKIVFQSLPGLYVTANFYLPKGPVKKLPAILYLCGHSPHPLGAKFTYQDRAIWFASHGYVCLVLDTLEFGEVAGIHHGTHDLNMWNWLSLGYTSAGAEVWNAIRALDYLETRPEVDKHQIGLTGISGGGAMTWYTAAVDDRITVAAPVCSTFTFGSQAEQWLASGQCDCIYFHNTYSWDFPIVGALIAPRPLLIISGQKDTIFPPDGYHAVFQRTKRIYDLYAGGNSDRIRELDDNVGHSDPPLFLRGARQWMQRWLKSDATELPLETNSPPLETAANLACLTQMPSDAINFKIQDRFTVVAKLKKPTSRRAWDHRRSELMALLKEKVFRWFPTESISFETKVSRSTGGWLARNGYADYKDVSFQTEEGARIRAQLLTPKDHQANAPLLVYSKRSIDSISFMDVDDILPVLGRCSVLIVNPRFTEKALTPSEFADIERTAVWTGRTIEAMQVWDILRAVRWAMDEEKVPVSTVVVYGKDEMGVLGLYASLFDERIKQVIVNNPPASHWQGPALLNVLRVTDIPEIAGALAPRRLTSLTKLPEAFEQTRRLFKIQNASEQFVQSDSLPEALEVWKYPAASAKKAK